MVSTPPPETTPEHAFQRTAGCIALATVNGECIVHDNLGASGHMTSVAQARIGSPTHVALPLRLVLRLAAPGFSSPNPARADSHIGFGDMTKQGMRRMPG